jgi:hypothetical protein
MLESALIRLPAVEGLSVGVDCHSRTGTGRPGNSPAGGDFPHFPDDGEIPYFTGDQWTRPVEQPDGTPCAGRASLQTTVSFPEPRSLMSDGHLESAAADLGALAGLASWPVNADRVDSWKPRPGDGVPLEYSIEWLTCAVASRFDAVMVG